MSSVAAEAVLMNGIGKAEASATAPAVFAKVRLDSFTRDIGALPEYFCLAARAAWRRRTASADASARAKIMSHHDAPALTLPDRNLTISDVHLRLLGQR
jgi:hypothetical protein